MSELDDPKGQEEAPDYPLPPPTFEFLVRSLVFQAELNLGMLPLGDEKDRPAPDLAMSRHQIDLLAVLQVKTKGNLTIEEQRLLENSLTELRFRYVQAAEDQQRGRQTAKAEEAEESRAAETQSS